MKLTLEVMPWTLGICQWPKEEPLPEWVRRSEFWSITHTHDEVSIVCEERLIPKEMQSELEWSILKVLGPLDFALTGILSQITAPLAEAEISIFSLSTYDTDYVMVKSSTLDEVCGILREIHDVIGG
ncbi:MAG: ACT domain-containing protein [Saprospiraceae bacterium]|nr:ACT domain-containing protein [Saprospiraceae bacterium]